MANLSREYCAFFGKATEVWKQHVIGEVVVAIDEYRDSVCQKFQEAGNSGPNASTGGGQDSSNQEEMFAGIQNVLENAQQQAEQRIVNALNQTLNQPLPVLLSPVVSIIENQTAQVNPPGESAISQSGVNSGQNDDDDNSLDVSIKSELDSESECESDTDDDEMQVKEEPNEDEDITGRSEEQTENDNNNFNDNRETNHSQNDHSNEAANEQESNDHAMMIDGEEASLEENPNGLNIIAFHYASPPSSPSNAEQSGNSLEFNSRSNVDNQMNMSEDIASDNEVEHTDVEDDDDGDLEEDENVDNMEIEESDNESSMIDEEESDGEESDHFEDQVDMSGVEDNDEEDENEDDSLLSDEDSTDDTTDGDDSEEEQAAGPSSSTGRRSTRQVSKHQTVSAGKSSKPPINVKKTKKLSVITQKLKCQMPGCKKVVKNKSALNSHLLSAHKLKKHRCLVRRCYGKVSTSFTTRSQLNDHRDQVHGSTSRWTCQCSKKFKSYKDLSTHYWRYHELGRFACSKEGCTFKPTSTRDKVMNHLRNHGEAKYVCPVDGCEWSFKQKSDRDRHTLTHSGERLFPCTECDKSFLLKAHLMRHLRVHRNDKCYRCTWPGCTHTSTNRSNVLRHIRTVHFELPATKKQQAEEEIEDDRDPRDYLAKD